MMTSPPPAYSMAPRLAWIGNDRAAFDAVAEAAQASDMQASSHVLAALLADEVPAVGTYWLRLSEGGGDGETRNALACIAERQAREQARLVIEAPAADSPAFLAAWDLLADRPGVDFLTAPDAVDRLTVLAAARRQPAPVLHESGVASRDREIEQLHSEVQRIARILANLAGEHTGIQGDFAEQGQFAPAAVRTPMRGYRGDGGRAGSGTEVGVAADLTTIAPSTVRALIRNRRLREEFFDTSLFADPAWDMMLDLYAARLERTRVSVSSLCIAAAVPATTVLRWIKTLTDSGLFVRESDPHDGRRIFVGLSNAATNAMTRYFLELGGRG